MKKLIILFIAVAGFGVSTYAQVEVAASSTATIVTPIGMTKSGNLNFGNIAVGATGGAVTLTPANARSADGGLTLPASNLGTVTVPAFTVTGQVNYSYSISITPSVTLTHTVDNTKTMVANGFNHDATRNLGSGGTETFHVGGVLTIVSATAQPAGTYTNASDLKVTVNYN